MRINEMQYLLVWGPGDQTKNVMHTSQVLSVKPLYHPLALALVLLYSEKSWCFVLSQIPGRRMRKVELSPSGTFLWYMPIDPALGRWREGSVRMSTNK